MLGNRRNLSCCHGSEQRFYMQSDTTCGVPQFLFVIIHGYYSNTSLRWTLQLKFNFMYISSPLGLFRNAENARYT